MEAKELWPGGPLYAGEPVQTDSLVLCAFAGGGRARRCAELGCGDGIALLLLAWENPALRADGVEFRPAAAAAARENLRRNGLEGRCAVCEADWRAAPLPAGAYDLVIANPPYFPAGSPASADSARALARRESAPPETLCAAAAALLRPSGRFCAVYCPERLPELLTAMERAGLAPKRLRCVTARAEAAPSLVLCEGRRGGRAGLEFAAPLIIADAAGRETAEYRRLCHWKEED